MKKIIAILMAVFLLGMAGCASQPGKTPGTGGGEEKPPVETEVEEMERDYVYMWNQSGVGGADKVMKVQTEKYALTSDAKDGAITAVGAYQTSEEGKYARADFSALIPVVSMDYKVSYEDTEMRFNRQQGYQRVIESGRYLQRADYNALLNSADTRWTGRMEIAATLDYFAINYEVHNGSDNTQTLGLEFSMEFGEELTSETLADGRGLTLRSASGQGLTVLRAAGDDQTKIAFSNNVLTVENDSVYAVSGTFTGFGVLVIPSADAKVTDADVVENVESCIVTAQDIDTGTAVPVTYDARRGIYVLDISQVNANVSQSTKSGRNTYDRVKFSIQNEGAEAAKVPLSFQKTGRVSVTGISPMIRDAETLEPTGIQVQISKNWHTNASTSVPQTDPSRYLEGQWYHGNTSIAVEAEKTAEYEYTCAYGEWGGVYAASHAQLCLIGWGGANNLLWEESAMGSWGESVTYDPDMGLGRSMIDDVRPFLVTSTQGGDQQYNWTGNVGGANFLDYYPTAKQSKLVDLISVYRAQAPNMTDVTYSGVTADGAIAAEITINMGRTDDVVRTYYTIRYTFLKDIEPERLSFFKLCADGYADNFFTKYAIGDASGILEKDVPSSSVTVGYNGEAVQAKNEQFWFALYASSNRGEENGDVSYIVRNYNADLNGTSYDKPSYRIFGTQNGALQPSCELTLPADIKKVEAGSSVEMTVEYLVLPGDAQSYYGTSDYLLENNLFGTADATFDQVDGGKVIAEVSTGTLKGNYPVTIAAAEGEVVAQFALTGGLGYVPVKICGVDGYSGYMLQRMEGGEWKNVVQTGSAKNTNDYWQVVRDAATGKYDFVYNVKNTEGLNYYTRNEYRLIKI